MESATLTPNRAWTSKSGATIEVNGIPTYAVLRHNKVWQVRLIDADTHLISGTIVHASATLKAGVAWGLCQSA